MHSSAVDTAIGSRPKTMCGVNPCTQDSPSEQVGPTADWSIPALPAAFMHGREGARQAGPAGLARRAARSIVRPRPCPEGSETFMASNVRYLNPKTLAKPPGYTYVVETSGPGRTVYVAGQLGLDLDNKLVGPPGDFRAQATKAFENLAAALAAVR